jgi:MOSC domain-containing protein YiiM
MPTIAAIWLKRAKRGPMDLVDSAELVAGRGLRGNANQGGKRQITIIDEAAWRAACDEIAVDVPPSRRRANVMLRGLDLEKTRGQFLRLGTCVIRIYGETTPCERMEEAQTGLRAALRPHWRGGVYGEIVEGGTICVGDEAEWSSGQVVK